MRMRTHELPRPVVDRIRGLPARLTRRVDAVVDAGEARMLGFSGDRRADGEQHDDADDREGGREPEAEGAAHGIQRQNEQTHDQPDDHDRDDLLEPLRHQEQVDRIAQEENSRQRTEQRHHGGGPA